MNSIKAHWRKVSFTALFSTWAGISYGLAHSRLNPNDQIFLWIMSGALLFGLWLLLLCKGGFKKTAAGLALAFLFLPSHGKAQDNGGNTNKSAVGVICGVVVIVGGVVIILSLKKMCQSLPPVAPPDTEPPPPPWWSGNTNLINPNLPPFYMTNGHMVTNFVIRPRPGGGSGGPVTLGMKDKTGVAYYTASGTGWHSPDGSPVQVVASTVLEGSDDLQTWAPIYRVSVYATSTGAQVVYRNPVDGSIISSRQAPVEQGEWGSLDEFPDLGSEAKHFYRLHTP